VHSAFFFHFRTAFDGRRSTQAWLHNLAPFQVFVDTSVIQDKTLTIYINSFSSGRKVAILSGVVLNAYIFQTIHRTETEIASFERGGLPLSNDTNFNFIPSLVNELLA
jgi:hypothetical protein